jgi:hypothetical protein
VNTGPVPQAPMTGSLILSDTALGLLGFVLTAIAVAQQFILTVPTGVHTVIVLIITVIGALGATSADAARLGKLIPHGIAVLLTTIATILVAVTGLSDIGQTWHAVIGGIVVLLASVGINPTSPVRPVPPSERVR